MRTRDPLKFERELLSNGIPVYTNPELPVDHVVLSVVSPVGSRNDPKGQEGVAHFMEHMPFKGTTHYPDTGGVSVPIDRCGGLLSAYTALEQIGFWAKVAPEDLDRAARTLNELTRRALMRDEDFVKERGVILTELEDIESDSQSHAHNILNGHLFKDHPLAKRPIGEELALKSLTVAHVRSFYADFIQRGTFILLVVGGSYSRSCVVKTLERVFGTRGVTASARLLAPLPAVKPKRFLIKNSEYPSSCLCMGVRAFPASDRKRNAAISVLSAMLQKGNSSPLDLALREPKTHKEGMLYSYDLSCCGHSEASVISFEAVVTRKKISLVRDTFLEVLWRVVPDGRRFKVAKTMLLKSKRIEEWRTGSICDEVAHAIIECRGEPISIKDELRDISGVSHEDVEALAQEYLAPEQFTVVEVRGSWA